MTDTPSAALRSILEQATRAKRGCTDEPEYLRRDLEFIAEIARAALAAREPEQPRAALDRDTKLRAAIRAGALLLRHQANKDEREGYQAAAAEGRACAAELERALAAQEPEHCKECGEPHAERPCPYLAAQKGERERSVCYSGSYNPLAPTEPPRKPEHDGPPVHIDRNGVSYVKPSELVQSPAFRREIERTRAALSEPEREEEREAVINAAQTILDYHRSKAEPQGRASMISWADISVLSRAVALARPASPSPELRERLWEIIRDALMYSREHPDTNDGDLADAGCNRFFALLAPHEEVRDGR